MNVDPTTSTKFPEAPFGFEAFTNHSWSGFMPLGSYSYSHSFVREISEIGRYCSIGANLKVVQNTHPLDRVSSSPVFYSPRKLPQLVTSSTRVMGEHLKAPILSTAEIRTVNTIFRLVSHTPMLEIGQKLRRLASHQVEISLSTGNQIASNWEKTIGLGDALLCRTAKWKRSTRWSKTAHRLR